ncbi:hypothetical protein WJX81_004525 [Elliptochloris bilobata]|uniref:Uncharacterized protein n=1 Tax=Elliptochloris bilobata TaxID=381761 RepID=A0AAW1RYF6_9CHLO
MTEEDDDMRTLGGQQISASEDEESESVVEHSGTSVPQSEPKKRRKKKKKKRGGAAGDGDGAANVQAEVPNKKENDRRFAATVEALESGAGNSEWGDLSFCNLHLEGTDAKSRKLLGALAKNTTMTSLDMSGNSITDEGAEALAKALQAGAAPELIVLDLRGNPLTDAAVAALRNLERQRKHLQVVTGPLTDFGNGPDAAAAGAAAEAAAEDDAQAGAPPGGPSGAAEGSLAQRFFQSEGEDMPSGFAESPIEPVEEPGVAAERLWREVGEGLAAGESGISALGAALRGVARGLAGEGAPGPLGRRPFAARAGARLRLLADALALAPPPVLSQSAGLQDAVGTHRVAAADAVSQLVGVNGAKLDRQIAALGIVPAVAALALARPACNALHCACLRLLRACLGSSVAALWQPLVEIPADAPAALPASEGALASADTNRAKSEGAGNERGSVAEPAAAARDPGAASAAPGSAAQEHEAAARSAPLQVALAEVGKAVAEMPVGRRPPLVGFVVAMARLLQERAQGKAALRTRLQATPAWQDFAGGPEGAMARLLAEQEGDLAGPRPQAPSAHSAMAGGLGPEGEGSLGLGLGAGGGLPPGGIISGRDLLLLLQNMQGIDMTGAPERG